MHTPTPTYAPLPQRISHDEMWVRRIKRKYSIKNTTGYSINALADFTDPFEILKHLVRDPNHHLQHQSLSLDLSFFLFFLFFLFFFFAHFQIVGSEGTLAFISTLPLPDQFGARCKSTGGVRPR